MKKLFFAAIAVLTLWGCGDSSKDTDITDTDVTDETVNWGDIPDGENDVYQYFIQEFIVPSKVEVKKPASELYLDVSGDSFYTTKKDHPSFKKAKELAEFYGDTSYNRENLPFANSPLAYPIDKITICCDKDFDTEHPAGKPLDDVVKLEFETFYEYVKNGYEIPADIPYKNRKGNEKVAHLLNFEDINAEVATLVEIFPFNGQMIKVTPIIHFASAPAEPGEYNFVLETTINGKVFKSEFAYTFERESE